ncbi:MAG: hypothetical protein ABWX96_04800 [Propionibacteriaceae bacterium]
MKWIVLILIIIVILIGFAIWRRMQVTGQPARTAPAAPPAAPPAVGPGSPDEPTLATEAGVDEVTPAPASESPPSGQPPPAQTSDHPDDWWQDHEGDRPQR